MIWSEIGPESKDFKEKRSKWNAVVDSSHRMWLFVEQSFVRVRSPQKKLYRCCSIDLWIKWSKIKCVWSSRSAIVVDSSWCCDVQIITVKNRGWLLCLKVKCAPVGWYKSTWFLRENPWKIPEKSWNRLSASWNRPKAARSIDNRFVVSIHWVGFGQVANERVFCTSEEKHHPHSSSSTSSSTASIWSTGRKIAR